MSNTKPEKSPCYCISFRRVANVLTKYYDAEFAKIDLTANQFFLLNSILKLKSCNKSELAHYARMDRTTIVRNLDVLLKKDLIEAVPGLTNRHKMIQLSENGRKAIREGIGIWEELQRETRHNLGEEGIAALWQLLAKVDSMDSQ